MGNYRSINDKKLVIFSFFCFDYPQVEFLVFESHSAITSFSMNFSEANVGLVFSKFVCLKSRVLCLEFFSFSLLAFDELNKYVRECFLLIFCHISK